MTQLYLLPVSVQKDCLGLPLEQAQAILRTFECEPDVIYTGERAAEKGLTPRVVALRENALIAAWFRDGDQRREEA